MKRPTGSPLATTRHWVAIFRERGYQPLPSDRDDKKPLIEFASNWETPFASDPFDRVISSNLQVMTGRHWRLLVIDLDGPAAVDLWASWGRCPKTWTVLSGSGNGRHLWFRLPDGLPPLPKSFLWKGTEKHSAVERLCDHSLAMAPPSVHPKTGRRYTWASKLESPIGMNQPADVPDWVLRRPAVSPPQRTRVAGPVYDPGPLRVGDVPSLVRSWGVRIAGPPSAKGWMPVHAIGREDRNPSAAIHAESGFYIDHKDSTRMTLVELGINLGIYTDWREAIRELRAR
jgi:hypothetical protein